MEHLHLLFPGHSTDELTRHWNESDHQLETAIENILQEGATNPPAKGPTAQDKGHTKGQTKWQVIPVDDDLTWSSVREAPAPLDLTQDTSDDDVEESFCSSYSAQGTSDIHGHPNFEDFHSEQQRLKFEAEQEAARQRNEIENQKRIFTENFVTSAQEMFDNISSTYLESLIAEMRPQFSSDEEAVENALDKIFSLKGKYPKAKRKLSEVDEGSRGLEDKVPNDQGDEDHGDVASGSSSGSTMPLRDYMDCSKRMGSAYDSDSVMQLFQDFPKILASSIRTCLQMHGFHYAPTFFRLQDVYQDFKKEGSGSGKAKAKDFQIVEMKSSRKAKAVDLNRLDKEFKREWQWVKAKIAKELAEIEELEEEARNLKHYADLNELMECGCCFDDIPPNRMAQCEDGHLFCLSCSKRGAEVELGYQRTFLKCMTSECKAGFSDSEAVKFLSPAVFQGLQRSRQQQELKMAGLDSLVECPFCSYAAVVENEHDKEFRCMAPTCRKVSCRLCKALTHIPLSCEEYRKEKEKDNVLLVQHKVEEEMSQALIRECPKCSSRFFKTEGCNKMHCTNCNINICYVCKIQVQDYSHFDNSPAGGPRRNKKLCPLWDNTVERNANDVKEAAQKFIKALENQKPELASQVQAQIPI